MEAIIAHSLAHQVITVLFTMPYYYYMFNITYHNNKIALYNDLHKEYTSPEMLAA